MRNKKRMPLVILSVLLVVIFLCIPVGAEESTVETAIDLTVSEYETEPSTAVQETEDTAEESESVEEEECLENIENEMTEEDEAHAAYLEWLYDAESIKAWFEERVLPNLTSTLLIIGVGLLELIPAIRSLLRARGAFQKAANDVDAYTQAKIEYDARAEEREKKFLERLEKYDEEIARTREETRLATERFAEIAKSYAELLHESESRLGDTLHQVENSAKKTEEMVYLGMSNSCELVRNGVARRIAEVEEREEEEVICDEDSGE